MTERKAGADIRPNLAPFLKRLETDAANDVSSILKKLE